MDVVKLALPADVSSGGGGGGGGGVGVTVMEVEARESESISIVVASSIDRCNSFLKQGSTFWSKMPDKEQCRRTNQLSSFDFEDAPKDLKFGCINGSTLPMHSHEAKPMQRKSGKVARSSSGWSKRSRMARMEEVSINEAEADNAKEKNQTAKQKNGLNGKRGEKRNAKVPMKSKYEYFSVKAGMMSFNSAAGGSNFFGTYGLKPDTCDVTKHLEELSVSELLNGSYKVPNFAKDQGKKAANSHEHILHSVRKACSILRLNKPLQTKNSTETDNNCDQKVSTCTVNSDASVASRNVGDRRDTCTADLSSNDKAPDSFSKSKTPAEVLDFPFHQPKDVLERLSLPPPKDLDCLLLDAAKPAILLRNNSDSRGKQIYQRASLSPFPWSHNSGKSNPDAIKLSASRSTCQGRWVKIGNTATSLEDRSGFLVDFESFTYDHSLVTLDGLKCDPSENEIVPSTYFSFPWFELGSSSAATRSIATELPPESGSRLKCEEDDGNSPRLLAAAQTLYDIATHSSKQELHGMVRWPKRPSEKTMKACKLKSNSKSREIFAAPKSKSLFLTDNQARNSTEMFPLKNPRLLSRDLGHNTARKGPVNWSMPRSSRPSPSKSFGDPFAETKDYSTHVVKQPCTMPPPPLPPPSSRVSGKACTSRQKLRKLVPMSWNREGGKLD